MIKPVIFVFVFFASSLHAESTIDLQRGTVVVREQGRQPSILSEGSEQVIPAHCIIHSETGMEGSFIFPEGHMEIEGEFIITRDSSSSLEVVLGVFTLEASSTWCIRTPSSRITLTQGSYRLSLMEGLGVLECSEGSAQVQSKLKSVSIGTGAKAVFNAKQNIIVKEAG